MDPAYKVLAYDNVSFVTTVETVRALVTGERFDHEWKADIFNLIMGFSVYQILVRRFYEATGKNADMINDSLKWGTALGVSGILGGKFGSREWLGGIMFTVLAILIYHYVLKEYFVEQLNIEEETLDVVEHTLLHSMIMITNQLGSGRDLTKPLFFKKVGGTVAGILAFHYGVKQYF